MAAPHGARYTGKVKSFNKESPIGFGFISCPMLFEQYGEDVYIHNKAVHLSGVDPMSVVVGAMVSFEVHVSAKGQPQANSIKVLGINGTGKGALGKAAKTTSLKGKLSKGKGESKDKGVKSSTSGRPAGSAPKITPRPGAGRGPQIIPKGSASAVSAAAPAPARRPPRQPPGSPPRRRPQVIPRGQQPQQRDSRANEARLDVVGEAVRQAVGKDGIASFSSKTSATGERAMVTLSLNTLNDLLQAAGGDIVQESEGDATEAGGDVAGEAPVEEAFPGYDGNKVAGPWFTGSLKQYFTEEGYGTVDSPWFKEQFGEKTLFVHASHIDPHGSGVEKDEEYMFPVVEDEDGHTWAWTPLIQKTRDFNGSIKSWSGGYGYIDCGELWPVFEEAIYVHGAAAELNGCSTTVGAPITFNLHVNKRGKPQAVSPRPPGTDPNSLPEPSGGLISAPKRRRVKEEL